MNLYSLHFQNGAYIVVVNDWFTKKILGAFVGSRSRACDWLEAVNGAVCRQFPAGIRERIYPDRSFFLPDGREILAGRISTKSNCIVVDCTVNDTTKILTIPPFSIYTTTNSTTNANVRLTAILYDSSNQKRETYLADFRVPHHLEPMLTWANLEFYVRQPVPNDSWKRGGYSAAQVDALLIKISLANLKMLLIYILATLPVPDAETGQIEDVIGWTQSITDAASDLMVGENDSSASIPLPAPLDPETAEIEDVISWIQDFKTAISGGA
jgi:hypothetical protein